MEVHLAPEKESQLLLLAQRTGRATSQVIEEAVDQFLENHFQESQIRFRAAVRAGFDSIDRGNFIEEEEMETRVRQMTGS